MNSTANENAIAKYKYPFGTAPTCCPTNSACDKCILSVININPIRIKKAKPKI